MTRKTRILYFCIAGIALVALIVAFVIPAGRGDLVSGRVSQAVSEARQVGIALTLYADEHGGRLPVRLPELVPTFLPSDRAERLMNHTLLTAPGAVLKDLHPHQAILIKMIPGESEQIAIVCANGSAHAIKP